MLTLCINAYPLIRDNYLARDFLVSTFHYYLGVFAPSPGAHASVMRV